jgi:hypothetical protein
MCQGSPRFAGQWIASSMPEGDVATELAGAQEPARLIPCLSMPESTSVTLPKTGADRVVCCGPLFEIDGPESGAPLCCDSWRSMRRLGRWIRSRSGAWRGKTPWRSSRIPSCGTRRPDRSISAGQSTPVLLLSVLAPHPSTALSNVSQFCCTASPMTSAAYPLLLRCQ